jgi:RNA polymerase sigma-70 factor (ECF subfamily)
LLALDPSPIVALNRAVAVAHVTGADAGLRALAPLLEGSELRSYNHLFAVEAELLARAGRPGEARRAVAEAIDLSRSRPVRLYLEQRRHEYERACEGPAGSDA